MTASAARLVMPAICWDDADGYAPARAAVDDALALGVGGFILFGGERAAARRLVEDLRAAAPHPLLIASDLERGAGQQLAGLTPLPPLRALAALGADAVAEAAAITAAEARDIGINWVFAPVCDLDIEAANPIVQTRSFGADAFEVGDLAARWIARCQAAGVLACAKHFPGHGRTVADSHATLPVVEAGHELNRDLTPFRRAVAADVATVMTAHVAYPRWDQSGAPATYSRSIVTGLLRRDLFFGGLVVTDALIMDGARAQGGEAAGAAAVIQAGGDILLYPREPRVAAGGLADLDVTGPLRRLDAALGRTAPPAPLADAAVATHRERGRALARQAVQVLQGDVRALRGAAAVEIVDDDAGGPYPLPPRTAFAEALARAGVALRPDGERIVLLFADVKGWKGRAGLSADSRRRLGALLERPATVVAFGHPRRVADVPGDGPVLCAWSGDTLMQEAAAHRLVSGTG